MTRVTEIRTSLKSKTHREVKASRLSKPLLRKPVENSRQAPLLAPGWGSEQCPVASQGAGKDATRMAPAKPWMTRACSLLTLPWACTLQPGPNAYSLEGTWLCFQPPKKQRDPPAGWGLRVGVGACECVT